MRALLETAPHNKDKHRAYDDVIDGFDAIRKNGMPMFTVFGARTTKAAVHL
jgi:hypothetical protein